jgi:hypothetical protein
LTDLIGRTNAYISENKERRLLLIRKISDFVAKILRIFGVLDSSDTEASGASREEILTPVLDVFAKFRTQLRDAAKQKKGEQKKERKKERKKEKERERGIILSLFRFFTHTFFLSSLFLSFSL